MLELIEQFAEAEGRMKWAPNKKLHFEVAVIKAIQTLGQVTLDEVIENLAALRMARRRSRQPLRVVREANAGWRGSAPRKTESAESSNAAPASATTPGKRRRHRFSLIDDPLGQSRQIWRHAAPFAA